MEEFGIAKDATHVISIRDFLEGWDASVIPGMEEELTGSKKDPAATEATILSTEIEVPVETVNELATVCGEDTLRCGQEPTDIELIQNLPDDVQLMTLRYRRQELDKRKRDQSYKHVSSIRKRYRQLDSKMLNLSGMRSKNIEKIPNKFLVQHPDVILSVMVVEGNIKQNISNIKWYVDQVFYVLGCEKLTDLRDKISCVNDLAVAGDFSSNPSAPGFYAKDIYKSGFFFIEGCFYNDMRESDCRDYSQTITDWLKTTNRSHLNFDTKNMEDVRFLDLNIRLGQPYLYMHQGDCEHLLLFSDIRLLSKDDLQDIREYPRLVRKKRQHRTKCRVCQMHSARWITENSEHTPENPCFFCDQCFHALHYDENGQKLGDFEAYRFFDNSAVV